MPEDGTTAAASFERFRAERLRAGADEVIERRWAPGEVVETHTHPFDADALVTEGGMWLTCAGETRHLRAGDTFHVGSDTFHVGSDTFHVGSDTFHVGSDTFHVGSGTPHSEKYGPRGATYWVARRNSG